MLPPHLRPIVKHVEQAIDKADSRANDRSKSAAEAQKEVAVAIQNIADEFNAYEATQAETERKKNHRENLTIASLVITLTLAVIAGLQFRTLEKQWETFEKSDRTLKDTLATNQAAQRAFVGVREIAIVPIGPPQMAVTAPDIYYEITAIWENSGTTETRDLEMAQGMLMGTAPQIPSWPLGREINTNKKVMLPKGTIEQDGFGLMSGAILNAVRDGRQSIFLFGYAKYLDAFGAKHITLACFVVSTSLVDYTKEGAKGRGRQCGEYNCADNDCKRYKNTAGLKDLIEYLE